MTKIKSYSSNITGLKKEKRCYGLLEYVSSERKKVVILSDFESNTLRQKRIKKHFK